MADLNTESLDRLLEPFFGYLHLGMFLDANDQLESLPTEFKTHPKMLEARLVLLMEMDKWEEGVLLGQSLIQLWPQELDFHFKPAYCLHELKRTKEAKMTLETAPESIKATALYC